MPLRLIVPDDVLTTYLAAAAERVTALRQADPTGSPAAQVGDAELAERADVTGSLAPSVGAPDPAQHADDAVLVRTGDLGAWEVTHRIVPTAGVATGGPGAIVLTTPVRADMIDEPVVWLRELSTTARLLARATVERYYGTAVRGWSETGEGAQAVVVEGPDALAPLETGYRDDLGRAWFILNGVPLVTHLLLVPVGADPAGVAEATRWVQEVGGLDKERRKKARERLAGRAGVPPSDMVDLLAAVRTSLDDADLTAAELLFQLARDPALPTPSFARYGPEPSPSGESAAEPLPATDGSDA